MLMMGKKISTERDDDGRLESGGVESLVKMLIGVRIVQ